MRLVTRTSDFLKDFANSLVRSLLRPGTGRRADRTGGRADPRPTTGHTAGEQTPPRTGGGPAGRVTPSPSTDDVSPGQSGRSATVEVDPGAIGRVRMAYSPRTDGDPDPGEIVWTWVPYAENDGRGKDRPVLVVAAESAGTVLAVQLTSRSHTGDTDFIPIGSGSWDAEDRPSWVNLDRVFRVHPAGMRREATALDERRFAKVKAALQVRYRWS